MLLRRSRLSSRTYQRPNHAYQITPYIPIAKHPTPSGPHLGTGLTKVPTSAKFVGKGMSIQLNGPPGVGKALTAEAIAETMRAGNNADETPIAGRGGPRHAQDISLFHLI
jgi:DNA polymerase III delta prime subunit